MPIYTIGTPDGRELDIEAPDEATALRGAQEWSAANPMRNATPKPARAPQPEQPRNSFMGDVAGFMSNVNRGAGVGDEAAAGLHAATGALSDGLAGRKGPGWGERMSQSMEHQRAVEDDYAARHPHLASLGRGLGMAATVFAPTGPAAALAQGSRVGNMARGAVSAGVNAAAYGLADRGTVQERVQAGSAAGWNPFVMGMGAGAAALAPAARRPAKPVDPNVAKLNREGVQMTPGQIRGGMAKVVEDQATSLPIVGPAITEARQRGMETYTRAPINRALNEIGEELPAGMTGNAAISHAQRKFSAAYDNLLPEGGVKADAEFEQGVRKITPVYETLTPARQKQVKSIIDNRVLKRLQMDGEVLSGDMYQQVGSELKNLIGRFGKSTDADQRGVAEVLQVVQDALDDAAARQNPQFAAAKTRIDKGYASLVQAETAAATTKAEGGVFTPAGFDSAVRSGENTVRRRGYAAGRSLNQDLADAGRAVLPSKVGDSGTAGRSMMGMVASVPGAVIGSAMGGPGAGTIAGIGATAAGLSAARRMYTESAVAAANKALSERISAQEREAALGALGELAQKSPEAARIYQQVQNRLQRAIGFGGAAAQEPQYRGRATGSR